MHTVDEIIPCPSCGAPLDDAGHCTYCGSQARGFWRDLNLGTPELAEAVMEGLDYYLVLNVARDADAVALADAYRERRRRYPDDPRRLHAPVARQLGLLEEAWRILSVPERRAVYDRLCVAQDTVPQAMRAEFRAMNCKNCGSPVPPAARTCPACGSERPIEVAEKPVQPVDQLPDYYTILGVQPKLAAPPPERWRVRAAPRGVSLDLFGLGDDDPPPTSQPLRFVPPSADDIRLGYLARKNELLFRNDPDAELELEVAYQVLIDDQRRSAYDGLLRDLRERGWTAERMRALSALDREVRAELKGEAAADGLALLEQGHGYLKLGLPQQAVPMLQRAVQALPQSAEAHYAYGLALWRSADLVSLTAHQLRQLVNAFETAARLDARLHEIVQPYIGVGSGMLLYNDGAITEATAHFRATAARYPQFAAGWRMCAAAALHHREWAIAADASRRALAIDPQCEPALLIAIVAAWRQNDREQAQQYAARLAALRGNGARPQTILHELGLR